MKILTLNSRGLGPRKSQLLFNEFISCCADICCVQETLLSEPPSSLHCDRCFWSPAIGPQGGVGVFFANNFDGVISRWLKDSDGRVLSILFTVDLLVFNLVCIYAPTCLTDRKVFFECLHQYFLPSDSRIIAGDFNCYDRQSDKLGGNFVPDKNLSDLVSACHLSDAWRKLHPRERQCTWFNSNFSIGSRLDKFLVSRHFMPSVVSCDIRPCSFSDHDFVYLSTRPNSETSRGPGLWKFNCSLLSNKDFLPCITDRLQVLAGALRHFPSVKLWWDFFKESIKAEIIAFAKEKQRRRSHERVVLTNRIFNLKTVLAAGDLSVGPEIAALESQLQSLIVGGLEGAKTRSRVQWLEEGERPTRYFFNLEHERVDRNGVSSILNDQGTEVFTSVEIEQVHRSFYSKLFSEEPIDPDYTASCLRSVTTSLSPLQCNSCEGLLTLDELSAAVRSLSVGKSPGSDGLTVEFYLAFWDILGPLLLRVANECFRDGELAASMKNSVTRLIFKKRGDRKDLKNWRPISLLNVDYKIISKVITTRLSHVLEDIVHPDQTCSVPGRSSFANVTLLRDVLDYIQRTDEATILVSLDQEKAFDRVNRCFLLDLLRAYGFGPQFCAWVRTFYKGASMQILLNGRLTTPIPLKRGVRQGDPLSPLLYVLCVEVLASLIRSSSGIEGFLLPGASGRQARVRLYADDTTLVLKDLSSLTNLFKCIQIYERGTGAKLNLSKTEAMWLGAWKARPDRPLGLTWVTKMKILGVVFGVVPTEDANWTPKLEKLEKSLNLWKSRSLSLPGKALIINTLGLSKLVYLARVLTVPPWVLARVNSLIWPFLWGCRMETVARNSCYFKVKEGGLGLVNLRLKAQSLRLAGMVATLADKNDSSLFLCRFFVGRRVSTLRPEWKPLRSNLFPNASSPTSFYESCLEVLMAIGDAKLDSKSIYQNLLIANCSSPSLSRHWSRLCGSGFSVRIFWSRIRDTLSENYLNDVSWLISLHAIKVRESLKNWGYINSDSCAICSRCETIEHCFLSCRRASRVWLRFSPTIASVLGSPFVPSPSTVFLFIWPPTPPKQASIARFLIKSILYGVWTFRNRATFRNGTETHRAIIRYILSEVSKRIRLDRIRLSESRFSERWILSSFCAIENGLLVIKM